MSDLRRKLAEAMGWRVEPRIAGLTDVRAWYVLRRPDGRYVPNPEWLPTSEHRLRFTDEADAWAAVPDYEHSDEALLDALDATGVTYRLTKLPTSTQFWGVDYGDKQTYRCELNTPIDSGRGPIIANGATRREAMLAALAAYYGIATPAEGGSGG